MNSELTSSSTHSALSARMSVMMFLQFFIWGAWYVTAPNYLGVIGFGADDFKWTYSVGPIAGMISPFFVGMVADRFFSTERVLATMHLLGGVILKVGIEGVMVHTGSIEIRPMLADSFDHWMILIGILINAAAPPVSA